MVPKKVRKVTPKSQSEKAADKKSKAFERAGTALIEGKDAKAKKVLEKQKKDEAKKPTQKQSVEILSEAHAIEMQITAQDLKLEGIKENYKEAKSFRERLVQRLRETVRDTKQQRLPFHDVPKNETQASKDAKSAGADAPKSDAAPASGKPIDEIDRELGGDNLEQVDRGTGEIKGDGIKTTISAGGKSVTFGSTKEFSNAVEKVAADPSRSKGPRAMSAPAFGAEA